MLGAGSEARGDLSGGGFGLDEGTGTVLISGSTGGRHFGDISQNGSERRCLPV